MKSLVVDNGAYFIKVGYAGDDCRVVPNCIFKSRGDKKRAYIADQVHELNEKTGLFLSLPFERGYLLNWDVEQQIWDHVFSPFEPNDTQLALTDPIYTVPALEDLSAELLFEDFGFAAVHKSCVPRWIASSENLAGRRCCLVVDCGYSFTHIVPLVDGNIVQRGVIRIDVGGKALTNQLKEWISYRELQVMEETFVINECKEDACFVSLNFDADMKASRSRNSQHIRREYVLPDFVNNCRGFLREIKSAEDNQQRITLGVERFGLPEALFRPCEIGLKQMGIGEAVAESVRRMDINVRGALLKNIHVVGGSTLFPNFRRRLSTEIRANVEDCYDVCLADVANAITHGWTCGSSLAKKNAFPGGFMTRAEYEEYGDDFSFNSRFLLFANDEAYEDDLKTMRITKDEKSAA